MQIIEHGQGEHLQAAVESYRKARHRVALTGAGISVGSGIPDFRSEGGLWTLFSPEEYATIEVFLSSPGKAWELYRALGRVLIGKEANGGHHALARLEAAGLLQGVVTQNVDNLHQQAGSRNVLEIHGDHQHLRCIRCGHMEAVREEHYQGIDVPLCPGCAFPLKPNVVLFGENVRSLDAIYALLADCDLLLVLGTSTQIYPAAGLPDYVKRNGGLIYEFNSDPAPVDGFSVNHSRTDYYVIGDLSLTLPAFAEAVVSA